jgi:16S rRNA (guanine527-N7)-methyltransferase
VNYEEGTEVTSVFYKGPKFFELENLENIPDNWESIGFEEVELSGTEGRTFAYFKNLDVPRGTNTNKQLVRLTQFI